MRSISRETIDNIILREAREVNTYYDAYFFGFGFKKEYIAILHTKNFEYMFVKDNLHKGYYCLLGVEN